MSRVVTGRVEDPASREQLGAGVADLAIMSPPYYKRDGATPELAVALGQLLGHVLKPGARAFVVFGQVREDWARPFEWHADILAGGHLAPLVAAQTQAWVKSIAVPSTEPVRGHCTPITHKADQLNDGWEFILHFTKGPAARPMDRLAIGVPFADKSNLARGTRGANGDRRCPGSAHFVPYATTGHSAKKEHRHAYPEALVERLIRLAAPPAGGVILDPFWGGGTTGAVAERLGFQALGLQWEAPPRPVREKGLDWAEAMALEQGGCP